MPVYQALNLPFDAEQLRQDARDWITAQAGPGYVIDPWTDWLLSAVARMGVEISVLASDFPPEAFSEFGTDVLRVPTLEATVAGGSVTVTAVDDVGYTLVVGATLDLQGVTFETTADLIIAPGDTVGTAPIAATVPGVAGSGLTGDATLIAPTPVWVQAVSVDAQTIGGTDGETADEYRDRLADELPTLSPKAILIEDFAALARRDAEVFRALAIDLYVPAGPGGIPVAQTNVAGAVTVAVISTSGDVVSNAAKTRVRTALADGRVLALQVAVIDPTYTSIDVTFVAHAHPQFDAALVEAQAEAAIAEFLSPAAWGRSLALDATSWVDEPSVRRNDLFGALYRVDGLRHVDTLTLAIHGNALGVLDLALAGPAALPRPGTIVGTVTL
jgi:Baseplate J-like protein